MVIVVRTFCHTISYHSEHSLGVLWVRFGSKGDCYRMSEILKSFFFKQKTAYEMRISDWSSDVCSSDLQVGAERIAEGADHDVGAHALRAVDIAVREAEDAISGVIGQRHADLPPRRAHQALRIGCGHRGAGQSKRQRRADKDRKSTRLNSSH